jgi:hypothetical protein
MITATAMLNIEIDVAPRSSVTTQAVKLSVCKLQFEAQVVNATAKAIPARPRRDARA